MTNDSTLGGYMDVHDRPPAFAGSDGQAYSAGVYVDPAPDEQGLFGAAVLFVQWSDTDAHPVGHIETPCLVHEATPAEAEAAIRRLSLHAVKDHLDRAIADRARRAV